jgi:prophage maintenance system killer protein
MSQRAYVRDRHGSPRERRLAEWYRAGTSPVEVLFRAAAVHQRSATPYAELRTTTVGAGEHIFPHALDVGPLLAMLFDQLVGERWRVCASLDDDLLMAAFAAHGVLAIHPFRDGNGRTAFDFATYLLMWRWGVAVSPLDLPEDVHGLVSGALRELDGPEVSATVEGFTDVATRLRAHLAAGSALQRLRLLGPLTAVAAALRGCLRSNLITQSLEPTS